MRSDLSEFVSFSAACLAAIRGEKTLSELAEHFDIHPNRIAQWKSQLLDGAASVFGGEAKLLPSAEAVEVKTLHAKIGALTLENDFLEGALTKAGVSTDRSSSAGWKAGLLSARAGSPSRELCVNGVESDDRPRARPFHPAAGCGTGHPPWQRLLHAACGLGRRGARASANTSSSTTRSAHTPA
jgi:transposase